MLYNVHENIYIFSKNISDYIIPKLEFHEEEKSDIHYEFFKREFYVLCKSVLHNRAFSGELRYQIYVQRTMSVVFSFF